MPSVCTTQYLYQASSTVLGTSTQFCTDPLKFSVVVVIGIGVFTVAFLGAFMIMFKK